MCVPHDIFRDASDQNMHQARPPMRGCDDEVDFLFCGVITNFVSRLARDYLSFEVDSAEIESFYKFAHLILGRGSRKLGREARVRRP